MKLKNQYGENLDLIVEGNQNSDTTVVFVHGLGTDKNEEGLFVDISKSLPYRIIRFDLSGYGKSDGKQEDANLQKHAKDIESVIDYAKKFNGRINIIAHSMGTFATLLLSPNGIAKTFLLCPPSSDTCRSIEATKKRILSRSGTVNETGISIYPRSNGQVQIIGPMFWKALREFNPIISMKAYSMKNDLFVFGALHDEVISKETVTSYKQIPNLKYIELEGDHNFTKPEDRAALLSKIIIFQK
jgi:pimeloyl-ACP methyl ester carboxylesterase